MARIKNYVSVEMTGDGSHLKQAVISSERVIDDYAAAVDRASKKAKSSARYNREFGQAIGGMRQQVTSAIGAVGGLVGAYSAWQGLQIADDFRLLEARISLATEKTGDYEQVSRQLYDISQKNGVALGDTVDLFVKVAASAGDMGKSNADVLKFSKTVQQLGIVSGASSEKMKNALQQMSQSFAGGIVRAEEFNSVLENTPEIARAMARGLGISVGQLRMRMLDGKLTAEDMFDAITDGAQEAQRKFDAMPVTIARATNALQTSFGNVLKKLDDTFGATESVSGAIQDLSGWLDSLDSSDLESLAIAAEAAGVGLTSMLVAKKVAPVLVAIGAASSTSAAGVTSLGAAIKLAIGPAGWIALAAGALGGLITVMADVREENLKMQRQMTRDDGGGAWNRSTVSIIDAYKQSLKNAERAMQSAEKAHGKMSAQFKAASKAAETMRREIDRLEKEQQQLEKSSKGVETASKKVGEAAKTTTTSLKKTTTATKRQSEAEKKAAAAKREAERQTKKLNDELTKQKAAYRGLLREINPLQAESDRYASKLAILNRELKDGRITTEQYEKQVWALDQKMLGFDKTLDKVGKTAKKVSRQADPFAKLWENSLDRVDKSFSSLFRNMLDGGLSSFKDFKREIGNIAKDLAAELAYTFAKKQLFGGAGGAGLASGLFGMDAAGVSAAGLGATGGAVSPVAAGAASALGVYGLYAGGGLIGGGQGANPYAAGAGGVIGGSAGMIFGGPLGAAAGSAVGGAVLGPVGAKWNRSGSGVQLGVSGAAIAGQNYQDYKKKGWTGNRWRKQLTALDAQLQQQLDAAFEAYKNAAANLGEAFGNTSVRVSEAINQFRARTEQMQLNGLSADEVQAKLQQWVDKTGAELIKAVVPETAGIFQVNAGIDVAQLMQPLADIASYLNEDFKPAFTANLNQLLTSNELSIKQQLILFDGQLADTQKIASTLKERATLEMQMLSVIKSVSENIANLFGATIESLRTDMMTKKEIFDRDFERLQNLRKQLENATLPEEIDRLSRDINATVNKLWQEAKTNISEIAVDAGKYQGEALATYLDAEKKTLNQQLQTFASESNAIAQNALKKMEDRVKSDHDDLAARFKTIMAAVGNDQKLAAAQQAEAARQLKESGRVIAESARAWLPVLQRIDSSMGNFFSKFGTAIAQQPARFEP